MDRKEATSMMVYIMDEIIKCIEGQKERFLELLGRVREIFLKEVIFEVSFSELSHTKV